MKKISKYKTVECQSRRDFDAEVNTLILLGWQPFGGVSFSATLTGGYCQAMVQYEELPDA